MSQDGNVSLGSIAKKGLSLLNAKLDDAIGAASSSTGVANVRLCPSCSTQLAEDARFCPGCGSPASTSVLPLPAGLPVTIPVGDTSSKETTSREQVFVGTIQKCPNCGSPIDATDAVCDDCGFRIVGRTASNSVQAFYSELVAIEKTRKKKSIFRAEELDVTDRQVITLINAFPIPNTVEEISEFMFMAASNIDVSASKRSLFNTQQGTPIKAISDAWVSKMKQAYSKAKMAFDDDPSFAHIESLYFGKMSELKMRS